jgi:hypothetical protein
MGKYVEVRDGLDPLTKPILDYLERIYGMPSVDVKAVALDSEVGRVQLITVTLMVRNRESVLADGGAIRTPYPPGAVVGENEWIGPSSENPAVPPPPGEDVTKIMRPAGYPMPESAPTWRRDA